MSNSIAERRVVPGRGWTNVRVAGRRSGEWARRNAASAWRGGHGWYQRQRRNGTRGKLTLAGTAILVLGFVLYADILLGTPRASEIRNMTHMPEATKVFDVNGELAFTIFKERRIAVSLAEMSPNILKAVLATEDQRFYQHRGVDPWRIAGAAVANVKNSDRIQGGSTITQQLARKSFLTDEKTIRRKIKEAFLAARIEEQFTKDEILETYLNKVYFGSGYYGVEAAARGYFGKHARDLDVAEAALLAGLIQAPSSYAPNSHLDRAVARREVVLNQMVDAGYLTRDEAKKIATTKPKIVDGFGHERTGQYFKNHVMRVLVERFGWERLSQGGLKVYATIDAKMQAAAEEAVARGIADVEKLRAFKHPKRGDPKAIREGRAPAYLQGALVAMDPMTGEVRAMVGGREFDESQFNRAMQSQRQAGSAFKPFVYAAALEAGYTPSTLVTGLDLPTEIPGGTWLPDDGNSTATAMTIREALRRSSNRAAVQVLRAVGIPRAVNYAKQMGLDAPAVPAMVLGAGDVTVLSMATGFGTFANGGLLQTPTFIRRVEDADGQVLYAETPQASRAISEETAFLMAQMLSDVVSGGTGWRAREAGFRYQAGGKTGTTNDYKDAWFVGFTPNLVTSVWLGFDEPKTIVAGGYAGTLAAPIWGRFMQKATGSRNPGWIKRPGGIITAEICTASGGLATEGCRRNAYFPGAAGASGLTGVTGEDAATPVGHIRHEYFRRGTEPGECPIHGGGSGRSWRSIIGPWSARTVLTGGDDGGPNIPSRVDKPPVATPAPFPTGTVQPKLPVPDPPASGRGRASGPAETAPEAPVAGPATASDTMKPAEEKRGFFGALRRIFSKEPAPPKPPPKSGRGGGG
jgi:penicillin-binding protein 1A